MASLRLMLWSPLALGLALVVVSGCGADTHRSLPAGLHTPQEAAIGRYEAVTRSEATAGASAKRRREQIESTERQFGLNDSFGGRAPPWTWVLRADGTYEYGLTNPLTGDWLAPRAERDRGRWRVDADGRRVTFTATSVIVDEETGASREVQYEQTGELVAEGLKLLPTVVHRRVSGALTPGEP